MCAFSNLNFYFFFSHLNQRRYLKRDRTFISLPTRFSDLAERIVLVVSRRSSYITKGTSRSIVSTLNFNSRCHLKVEFFLFCLKKKKTSLLGRPSHSQRSSDSTQCSSIAYNLVHLRGFRLHFLLSFSLSKNK